MKYLIKAITTNNRDLKTSIYFALEERAYLFNCPDGFQRLALNQKMKFKSVRYVFLSNAHPDYYGGFPGFYLSSREAAFGQGESQIFKMGVYGPKVLQEMLKQGRSFIGYLNLLEVFDYQQMDRYLTEIYDGNEVHTQYVTRFLNNEEQKHDQQHEESKMTDQTNLKSYFEDEYVKIIPVRVFSLDQKEHECYSFICIPKQAKGKFLPKKAIELGCDPKFHFKILSSGSPVTLENGNIVYPFQVLEDPLPSQSFIFVFMPNHNYLQHFLSEEITKSYEPFFADQIDHKKISIHIVYHSVPLSVVLDPRYKDFMMRFGSNVKHIFDCPEATNEVTSRVKAYALSSRHKLVCPSLIPLSAQALRNDETLNKEKIDEFYKDFQWFSSKMGLTYNLFPLNSQGFDDNGVIRREDINNETEDAVQNELYQTIRSLIELKKMEDPDTPYDELYKANTDIDDKDPQILFLGTISMKPTMYRAASAIYLFLRGKGLLMDCAEGSYGQIYDHFQDLKKVNEAILKMRVVFITHIHGDHQLGIIKIMAERDKLLQEEDPKNRLYIVTPTPMMEYMNDFRLNTLRYPNMVVLVPSNDLNPETQMFYEYNEERRAQGIPKPTCHEKPFSQINQMIADHIPKTEEAKEMNHVLQDELGVNFIKAIEVDHCIESYGCLLESQDFGRLFYSGDTRPCQNVLNFAQNVHVLIHEATFDDSLAADAHHKKHTTMGQALDIAKKVNAYRTVITHFSPRYQKVAEISQRHIESKTIVAFDHMRFRVSYLEWAYKFIDIYAKLFKNDDVIETQAPEEKKPTQPQKPKGKGAQKSFMKQQLHNHGSPRTQE